jgi:HEAT repeat protein
LLTIASNAGPDPGDLASRALAVQALGEGGDPRAVPALRALRSSEHPALAAQAAVALARLGEPPAPETATQLDSPPLSPSEQAAQLMRGEAYDRARALASAAAPREAP